jgi:import inner membrane translocase subunit TIM50
MIKTLLKSAARSRLMKRAFAENAKHNESKANEENDQQEEEFDHDDYETEEKPSKFKLIFRAVALTGFGILGLNSVYLYLDNADEEISQKRFGYISSFYKFPSYIKGKSTDGYNYLVSPPISKFLPDQPPIRANMLNKTLVLNFEGTLYSKDFQAGKGVVLHLRPGFQKFIDEMSQLYEVVVYSEEDSYFLAEASLTIDPMRRYFQWVFGREFLVLDKTKYVKDISMLNRDLRKIVVIDFNKEAYKNDPENLIIVDKYHGEEYEDTLKYLSIYLNHLANPSVKDVRKEIMKYGGLDSLEKFKKEVQERAEKLKKNQKFFSPQARKIKN